MTDEAVNYLLATTSKILVSCFSSYLEVVATDKDISPSVYR
jgi:hypothetical protein